MTTFAIGDVQGCFQELQELLTTIGFNREQDTLWSVGDLVNRGPDSLAVLRFFKSLGDRAVVVLGNHDLHLLALASGNETYAHKSDTLAAVLAAPDRAELIDWLRHRPLLYHDSNLNFTLVHAGILPQWNLAQAQGYAREAETVLQSVAYSEFLQHIYGSKPKKWSDSLQGWERLRFIVNSFTRMRYCNEEGKLGLKKKGAPSVEMQAEDGFLPWFLHPHRQNRDLRIVFGHWATLGYHAGDGVYALDTGCLWGGALTALRLEDTHVVSVPCKGEATPKYKIKN